MKPIPANEVIDVSAGTGGLVHVSAFLAQAFAQVAGVDAPAPRVADYRAPVVMSGPQRADIAKCHGDRLVACDSCMRRLAGDAGTEQRWTAPAIKDGSCALYASQERYGALYESNTQ